jgi:hypothetical protein
MEGSCYTSPAREAYDHHTWKEVATPALQEKLTIIIPNININIKEFHKTESSFIF